MASIDIVICATASGHVLTRCVAAVAAQGPSNVWLALADLDAGEDPCADVPGVRVLRVRGPGLAAARNAALAASSADILAFVEEDTVVATGWLSSLQAAWDAAPAHVGAIGGPIALELPAAPSPGVGELVRASFATLDYGAAQLVLDPALRTLHGGNLSVRSAALRTIGGFWPAHGHRDGRDWFSEEHHAQRELADAGWEVRYEPGACVSRVPAPGMVRPASLLRRRWRYGARTSAGGTPRPLRVALAQAASSAGGAALAIAQRRPALALERASRVAENAGSLLGRRVAARDFRPTGPRPFGNQIRQAPTSPRRAVAQSGPGAAILLYHRVAEPTDGSDGMCVSPGHFAEQLDCLKAHRVLGLDELAELTRAARLPAGAVAVSFDDGYRDVLDNALPRLTAAAVPATVFISTGHVADQQPFFWDELARLLVGPGARPPQLTLSFADGTRAWRTDTAERRNAARRQIHHLIQPAAPATIEGVLGELAAWADALPPPDGPRAMTIDELRTLAASPLITVGAHTVQHSNLGSQSEHAQREEVEHSRAHLVDWVGSTPAGFAYPFGIPDVDFDDRTRRLVAAAGFRYAVANHDGIVSASSDAYALPRYFVPDIGGDEFTDWLRVRLCPG